MKEMTLKELQQFGLDILNDIHQFCTKNGIKYSLAYGSLIGAMRHGGFIPWDDDVDIMMPRPDYERFCATYQSEKYHILSSSDDDCYLLFSRVCDNEKTIVKCAVPWTKREEGVWVDVFPLDGAENDDTEYKTRWKRIHRMWVKIYRCRACMRSMDKDFSMISNIKVLVKKFLYNDGRKINYYKKMQDVESRKVPYTEDGRWCQLACCDNGDHELGMAKDFEKLILVPFEQYEFYVSAAYDRILQNVYGNWREIPPAKDRVPKSDGIAKFYWK